VIENMSVNVGGRPASLTNIGLIQAGTSALWLTYRQQVEQLPCLYVFLCAYAYVFDSLQENLTKVKDDICIVFSCSAYIVFQRWRWMYQ
jgi:hypothetical protein